MRQFHFYHEDTGILNDSCISLNVQDAERVAALNCPPRHKPIEGVFDSSCHRVDVAAPPELVEIFNEHDGQPNGKRIVPRVIDYIPPQPSPDHEWNATAKRWHMSNAAQARAASKAAALARIAELEASQTTWLRRHALGDPAAIGHLREIDDEIAVLGG